MAPKVPVKTSNVTLEPSQSTAKKKGTSKAAEIRARNTGAAVSKGSVGSAPLPAPEGSSVRRSFVPRLSTKLSLRSMTKARGEPQYTSTSPGAAPNKAKAEPSCSIATPAVKKNVSEAGTMVAPESSRPSTPVVAGDSSNGKPGRVYVSMPFDLGGLVVSSWLVPTVKRPFRGVITFVFACLIQAGFLAYMSFAMWIELPPRSPCDSPALLQGLGVYCFITAMIQEVHAHQLLHICRHTTTLKVPGEPEAVDREGRLRMGEAKIIQVRETSVKARRILTLAPAAQLLIELSTVVIGTLYLILSENIEELILNVVAVNFVTRIDDLMLHSFINKAALKRMSKYLVEQAYGIEEGDTQMKNATAFSRRIETLREYSPVVVFFLTIIAVMSGQAYGRVVGARDPTRPQCTWMTDYH